MGGMPAYQKSVVHPTRKCNHAGIVLWCRHAREHTVTKPTILLVAPLGSGGSATNVIGGNRILAEESMRMLRRHGFGFETVDTSGSVTNLPRWRLRLARGERLARVLWATVKRVRQARIVLLISSPYAMPVLATALWLVCKAARRPLVLRVSGGDFGRLQRRRGWALARRTYMRCSRVYVETRQLRRDCQRFERTALHPHIQSISRVMVSLPIKLRGFTATNKSTVYIATSRTMGTHRHLSTSVCLATIPVINTTHWSDHQKRWSVHSHIVPLSSLH